MRRIVILGVRDPNTYLLINQLLTSFSVDLVIFENRSVRKNLVLLRRRIHRLGLKQVVGQLAFMFWDSLYLRRQSRPKVAHLLRGVDSSPPDGRVRTLDVEDINSPETMRQLESANVCCAVVSGTSILGKPLLATIPLWLNIHCGITPLYRGVHGAFWAVKDGRPHLAGVTIHQIDPGIDTGAIVAQDTIEIGPSDTHMTLAAKQYLKGSLLMVRAVEQALNGSLCTYHRTDLESKLRSTPTIFDYLQFKRQLRKLSGT